MNTNNNFYLIDKPLKITSFDVIRDLRKKLNQRKMWHTWTLDPLASGALLVATWNYTKLIPYLEKNTKEYEFVVNLDWVSPSYDLWTEVEYISEEDKEKYKKEITKSVIENLIKEKFTWEIEQVPPKYSALKIWGKKALEKVKWWEDFEMKKRKATIYSIELLDYSYPELKLRAKVSAWTYIRSIAYDMWEILWTGGYISYLRRTKIWNIDLKNANSLSDFDESNSLNEKELFWKDRFINLGERNLDKINTWLTQRVDLSVLEWDYFIEKDHKITNIINYNNGIVKPIKRVL